MGFFSKLKGIFKGAARGDILGLDEKADKVDRTGTTNTIERKSSVPQTYTVQPGDSLSAIALKAYGDGSAYMKIYEANRSLLSDPDKIYPGQVLRIPD